MPPPPAPVQFAGKLLERGTRKPLKDVPIAIKVKGKVILELATDAEGYFRAKVPSPVFTVVGISSRHERLEVVIEAVAGEEREELYYLQELGGRFEEVVRGRPETVTCGSFHGKVMLVAGTQGMPSKLSKPPGVGVLRRAGRRAGHLTRFQPGRQSGFTRRT